MKLFGRDKDNEEEKPIVFYYAKYIGVLGSNRSLPLEEGAYVYIFEDRIDILFLKSKGGLLLTSKGAAKITIPYRNMTDLQNIDAGNKVDLDRVLGLSLASLGVGTLIGLLWKRHHIVTIIKYTDEAQTPQTIALDFLANTKYAQPLINRKFREVHPRACTCSTKRHKPRNTVNCR
ncbi:MAG TPA: hypothetical protein VE573_20505 [Nitrososphaeraceae archaeon]|nr:hypothetical protein [Nitrososphaeraceae archaeon]